MADFEIARKGLVTSRELLSRILGEKLFIAGCGAFALVLGLFFLMSSPSTYTATMTVAPPSISQVPMPGQSLGGLGDMFGSGSTGPDSFKLYLQLIVSQAAADRMEREHHVMHLVFAGQWDAQNNRWRPRTGLRAMISNGLHALVGRPPVPDGPSLQDLGDFLQASVRVDTPVLSSPVRVISFTSADPRLAATFLLWAHEAADHLVRESTRQRTTGMIAYLRDRLPTITNTEEHYALTNLLTEQERTLMVMSNGIDYSAMIVDPPAIPEKPFPSIGKTLFLYLFAGLGAASIFVIAVPMPQEGRLPGMLAWLAGLWRKSTGLAGRRMSRAAPRPEIRQHPR